MRFALAWLVVVTGCDLYFNDGHDVCAFDQGAPIVAEEFRNPDTGQCEDFGSPGCDNPCAPCVEVPAIPQPDWGSCFSECEGRDETSCIDQPRCRAVYDANSTIDQPPQYLDCWAIAPSGPDPIATCDGLAAYDCSRHANCSAFYDVSEPTGTFTFTACKAEKLTQGL